MKRPEGHVFTAEELRAMTVAEYDANADAIDAQVRSRAAEAVADRPSLRRTLGQAEVREAGLPDA